MAIDISWLGGGMPIFAFALVFVLVFAILAKTKILGGSAINVIISLIITLIFVSVSEVRDYIINITPWFAVILTVLFLFLLIISFAVGDPGAFLKPLAVIFIIILAIVLIVAAFGTFSGSKAFLPGADESGANATLLNIKHFIFSESVLSGILLLVVAIIVGFIITR